MAGLSALRQVPGFLLQVVATLLGLLAVTFFIGRVVPIDPVLAVVGDQAPRDVYEAVRRELGLDQSLWVQFSIYVQKMAVGDFGQSLVTNRRSRARPVRAASRRHAGSVSASPS